MLTGHTIEIISKQAVAEYPSECCGIVTGNASAQRVHPCRNRQDELHARDPERHPRTSREVVCFYHSHIDCGAYFSQMDKEVLTVFGEPEFPDALHVVVSVQDRQVKEISGFRWGGTEQDFVPVMVS